VTLRPGEWSLGVKRSSGVLLHVSSLPGHRGIGTAGPEAKRFVDLLSEAGCGYWQTLPLVPTGYADSPYSGLSAFAGNPLLIAEEYLVREEWLTEDETAASLGSTATVEYGPVGTGKMLLLHRAYERFPASGHDEFDGYRETNRDWLDDFALYMAIKDANELRPWWEWETGLRMRHPEALEAARRSLSGEIRFHQFLQFVFDSQWRELKAYANDRRVRLIGDMPIFVAHDSADVWSHPELFRLDTDRVPEVVAGVPPDSFTETGQLWGNPQYRWDVMRADGYAWWIARMQASLDRMDLIRLDHFRGFLASWSIPYGNTTAEHGEWVPAPGAEMFRAMKAALGDLPIITEDLGFITPDVVNLRLEMGWPGMMVLHFAFDGDSRNPSLPHNYEHNTVVYTGTSDCDTTAGWYATSNENTRHFLRRYLHSDGADIPGDLARLAFGTVADLAIMPLQDLFRLGSEARINLPGTTHGNWQWRFAWDEFTPQYQEEFACLSSTYGRDARLD
jgi:4-alpha-glucanotransferase